MHSLGIYPFKILNNFLFKNHKFKYNVRLLYFLFELLKRLVKHLYTFYWRVWHRFFVQKTANASQILDFYL